jgi:mannonate dehydratase
MKTSRRTVLLTPAGLAFAPAGRGQDPLSVPGAWLPKLSENLSDVRPATLRWLRQLGCSHAVFQGTDSVDQDKKGYWSAADVRRIQQSCTEAGLTLESMMLPIGSYRQAQLGRPGRDQEIENTIRTIRAAGEAGLPLMEWRFWPDFYWDQRVGYYTREGRGKARVRGFDYSRIKDAPPLEEVGATTQEEMWERLRYFGRPVIEAAERAGIRLSIHPSDPPVANMRGSARLFHHPDTFVRFLGEFPSPASGITFCQGTFTEMGADVLEEIRRFGRMRKIFLVHLRGVQGKVPNYVEVFIDEGDVNMVKAMRTYREVGYTGPIVSDHTPGVEGDTSWGIAGRSFSLGYIRALVQAVNTL